MPPSQGSAHPLRLLGVYAALLAVIYALVFFTGDKSPTPKLGIDLQGGTRVTLTARTPDGSKPSQDSLQKAQEIIENRVNGLGVSGSEVAIEGDNIVITVPGDDGQQARALATTAKLYIRPVLQAVPKGATIPQTPPAQVPVPDAGQQVPTDGPAPEAPAPEAPPQEPPAEDAPAPQQRVFPAQAPTEPADPTLTPQEEAQREIAAAKATRQSTDPATQQAAMAALDCTKADPLAGNDDPNLPLVTCSQDGTEVFLLDKSRIDGQEIKNAVANLDQQQSRWVVDLEFKSTGSDAWADLTGEYLYKRVAFTLDSKVVSAPQVQAGPQLGGTTQISGSFTATTSKELANTLKYGSLPLSFQTSEAETVSATLGLSSLRAGLIAGAIGLAIVLLYCLVYYRMLGFLTGLSLIASGLAVYGIMVLLGRWIGFTLDLAGIAGLIIGIGMTADSFVVFFERIKDEMREGRSFRSAVPRGWQRARRTILSGNAVSFIAAAVLYWLAAGQVKGFAFTLGLTTILDVVVVFLVTAPLVLLASRSAFWSKPSINGLGAIQEVARERRAAEAAVAEGVRTR
ncbi:preprotein translocase subunit SecD [Nocardia amikacinitolerans]|uniref:Protein translocase subunit SecD n=1 Tax=Nocardia amikacinitolerans TaxID=756689 RepID=A0A285M092_9NOCA|nr:protein translocase subunit SecD [Nocardia amikacinitolerans]MCP2279088.1 preprotein translocase subunit SecD [Nocardia amikacinitolerans]SNY89306.1 preprotein translocase subunit SecD [Nocardia amikacinitolerans]